MRILVLTNFYPPHFVGGYELGCRDVVEGLKARGHDVAVLTSTYKVSAARRDDDVYRWLESDFGRNSSSFFSLLRKEAANRHAFKRVCADFKPDLLYAWNLTYISISSIFAAQRMGLPVRYLVSDHWLSQWENDAWVRQMRRTPRRLHRRLAWRVLRPLLRIGGLWLNDSLDLRTVQFVSRFLSRAALEAGKRVVDPEIIHWGIDLGRFPFNRLAPDPSRLLYVGQLTAHKGVHTAVEALKLLRTRYGCDDAQLTIVGGPDYDRRTERLVDSLELRDHVTFTGLIPREQLPEIYGQHGILVFPSVWDEPFSITALEAMSSGLAVVGTGTGGSPELFVANVNALLFAPEDADTCAQQVKRLIDDRQLYERIRANGRATIENGFRFDAMLDKIEASLLSVR